MYTHVLYKTFVAVNIIFLTMAIVGVRCSVILTRGTRYWHANNKNHQLDDNNISFGAVQQSDSGIAMMPAESYDVHADIAFVYEAAGPDTTLRIKGGHIKEAESIGAAMVNASNGEWKETTEKGGMFATDAVSDGAVKEGNAVDGYVIRAATVDAAMEAINTSAQRKKRELADWLIAPNTRWCGKGNTANGTYSRLGGAAAADKCCRKHDHCQYQIPAMANRYNLFNYRPYTLSHCQCDRRFHTCLKMSGDTDADTIGQLFFNMMQTDCFVVRQEKVCMERADDGSCRREETKRKAYAKNNKWY